MSEYTRVTVQGRARKADVVLPGDEPVAGILPDLLTLLEETDTTSSRPVVLTTLLGDQLDPARSLAEQSIRHGALLRVVRIDEAPAPPEVADVTDVAADVHNERADTWSQAWTTAATAAAALALGATAASLPNTGIGAGPVFAATALLTIVATALARRGLRPTAIVLTTAAVGTVAAGSNNLVGVTANPGVASALGGTALVTFGLIGTLVALVAAVGFGDRALALGGSVAAALTLLAVGLDSLGLPPTRTAAAVATAGAFTVGLLPGVAMTVSGLSGLDDRVTAGRRTTREVAHRTVDAAFRSLTWAAVATSVVTANATWVLVRGDGADDAPGLWSRLLAIAVAAVLLLRARVLPLAPQRLALLAAGATPLFGLLIDLGSTRPGAALGIAGTAVIAFAALLGAEVSAHVRARLRKLADVVELVAVLSLVPLVLAHAGVFTDLIGTF